MQVREWSLQWSLVMLIFSVSTESTPSQVATDLFSAVTRGFYSYNGWAQFVPSEK